MTLTQEHWWVNAESARWIGHSKSNPTSTATATLLHRNAATLPHGHVTCDLNCDGSLEGDPLIVARTVLKLSNGVATARPPF